MDVKSGFGAQGDDRTDDTAAVQAALDHVSRVGGVLTFPRGIYRVSDLSMHWHNPAPPVILRGEGQRVSVLRRLGAGPAPVLTLDATTVRDTLSAFEDFSIDSAAPSGVGLLTRNIARADFTRVRVENCSVGWENQGSLTLRVSSCTFEGNVIGIRKREWGGVTPNLIVLLHCQIYGSRQWGVDLGDGDGIRLLDCELATNGSSGDSASGAAILRAALGKGSGTGMVGFEGCWFESNRGHGLLVEDAPMLALTVRDSVFYASEGHSAITIGRVRSVNLEGVRAPSPGDIVRIKAAISTVRGGLIHTLDDRSVNQSHSFVTTGAGLLGLAGN